MAAKTVQELKKKKKKWIQILSSSEFNNQEIGETYVDEAESCIGRSIELNLMMLTKDPRKQNFNVKFKITEAKNNQLHTELVAYSLQVAQLKRLTKKGKNKVEDSFSYNTKDNIKIAIKPILLTKALTYKTTLSQLRMLSREFLQDYVKNNDYSQVMKDVISGKLQKDLKINSKKVSPVVNCIIKSANRLNSKRF